MPKYCAHCNAEIESLGYACDYTEYGRESGSCDLGGNDCSSDDRDGNDYDTDNYTYFCPECNHEINLDDDLLDEPSSEMTPRESHATPTARPRARMVPPINRADELPKIECPECHKINFREDNSQVIFCSFCNNEIII
jgi:hypothetical protein